MVGCLLCDTDNDFFRKVTYDNVTGMYVMTCEVIEDTANYEALEDVKCPELGYISKLSGYIVEEQTLECVACSTELPNCQFCSNTGTCDFCKLNFLPV